jgi:hypothetical protein
VRAVILVVNGRIYTVAGLVDGEQRLSIDIGRAIADDPDGTAQVWLDARGDAGGSVMVRIHN